MRFSPMHYFPLGTPFLFLLFAIFSVLFALIQFGVLQYAYAKIGIQPRYIFLVLILSLLGSYINIPIAEIPQQQVESDRIVTYWGVQHVVPEADPGKTIVAINVGGALIPMVLSVYLMIKNQLYLQSLAGVAILALLVNRLAYPVPGLGIALPPLIPPFGAALIALGLSKRTAPALAYIVGSLGTLIGADILNLGVIGGLGAPVVSIGGAGTFDGVFLSGILAVLLA